MVKKFIVNVLFTLIIIGIVFGITSIAGYIVSFLMQIATGISIAPYRISCILLTIFILLALVNIYYEVIDRLSNTSK